MLESFLKFNEDKCTTFTTFGLRNKLAIKKN